MGEGEGNGVGVGTGVGVGVGVGFGVGVGVGASDGRLGSFEGVLEGSSAEGDGVGVARDSLSVEASLSQGQSTEGMLSGEGSSKITVI